MARQLRRDVRPARSSTAHRINVGFTLLALIFLIVMAAAAGVHTTPSAAGLKPRGETLAVLGVAPGSDQAMPAVPGTREASPRR